MENINSLRPGTILKGEQSYRIESVLGAGGFGITYLAQTSVRVNNISVSVPFAIKEHFISDYCERQADGRTAVCVGTQKIREMFDRSLKDFIAEARRLSAIGAQHDNIVKVNEIIEANGTAYYVMEYLKGKSLWDYIRERGPLSEEEMRRLMLPIVDAVAYLHSSHMTHLDIKPQNIMLAEDEFTHRVRPVLIDFGMSKHYAQDGSPTSTINTRACSDGYSPVEQYSGITTFSPTADVYALGATILTCLTGRIPTVSTNWPLGEPFRTIDALPVSEDLKEILKKSMAPAAHGRYANSGALYRALTMPQSVDTTPIPPEIPEEPKGGNGTQPIIPGNGEDSGTGNGAGISGTEDDSKAGTGCVILFIVWLGIILVGIITYLYSENELTERHRREAVAYEVPAPVENVAEDSTPEDNRQEAIRQEAERQEAARQESARQEGDDFWRAYRIPANLDLAVRRPDDNTYYFNQTEWSNLSLSRKSSLEKCGVVIIKNGEGFILSLDCTETMNWYEAMRLYSSQMPTKEQGEAISSQYEAIDAAICAYGGQIPSDNNWYWTKSEYSSSHAWNVSMNNGGVYYTSKIASNRVRSITPCALSQQNEARRRQNEMQRHRPPKRTPLSEEVPEL